VPYPILYARVCAFENALTAFPIQPPVQPDGKFPVEKIRKSRPFGRLPIFALMT